MATWKPASGFPNNAQTSNEPQNNLGVISSAVRTTLGVFPRITTGTFQDGADTSEMQIRIENEAPGVGHSTIDQDGTTIMEVVLITPTLYLKQSGSDWQILEGDQAVSYANIFTGNIDPQAYMQEIDAQVQFSVTPGGRKH